MNRILKFVLPLFFLILIGWPFARKKIPAVTESEIHEIDPLRPQGNIGRLVMIYGIPSTPDLVADIEYLKPIGKNVLYLKRNVEYFQWIDVETRDIARDNIGTTSTMRKRTDARLAWAHPKTPYRSLIKENPTFAIEEYMKGAYSVRIGKVWIYGTRWSPLDGKELPLTSGMLTGKAKRFTLIKNKLYSNPQAEEDPQLGDVRIWYTVIMPEGITAAGILDGENALRAWFEGKSINMGGAIVPEHISKPELIKRHFQKDGWIWN